MKPFSGFRSRDTMRPDVRRYPQRPLVAHSTRRVVAPDALRPVSGRQPFSATPPTRPFVAPCDQPKRHPHPDFSPNQSVHSPPSPCRQSHILGVFSGLLCSQTTPYFARHTTCTYGSPSPSRCHVGGRAVVRRWIVPCSISRKDANWTTHDLTVWCVVPLLMGEEFGLIEGPTDSF
jgi:hypothetical protein